MAHERKRIHRALDRRWQSRHEPLVVSSTLVETTPTQVQLSSQNMAQDSGRPGNVETVCQSGARYWPDTEGISGPTHLWCQETFTGT